MTSLPRMYSSSLRSAIVNAPGGPERRAHRARVGVGQGEAKLGAGDEGLADAGGTGDGDVWCWATHWQATAQGENALRWG